jgi:hypothetical protein
MGALTDRFYVMHGEEVHPKGGSYFHIVSLNADRHVSALFEERPDYVKAEIERIVAQNDFSALPDPYAAAYRIFIAEEIRRAGGFAVLAHPFWETDGEYNYQPVECRYHIRAGHFDALELFGGNDGTGNGNNLLELVYHDLRGEGCRIPIVGSSDAHTTVNCGDYDHFAKQFSLIFATGTDDLLPAVSDGRSVAVRRESDKHFRCVGDFRYAKYARFIMAEYYPYYTTLCAAHAAALDNIHRNGLEPRMHSICADLRTVNTLFSPGSFSCCVSNPPYFSGGPASVTTPLARREDCCTPTELFAAAAWALKYGGDFYLVHKPERLGQLCGCAVAAGLEPKRLRLIRHQADGPVSLILLACRKGGKPGLVWEETTLFDQHNQPTAYYKELYHI